MSQADVRDEAPAGLQAAPRADEQAAPRAVEPGSAQGGVSKVTIEAYLARTHPERARVCVALLVLLAFSLGCSEFIVIGMQSELAADLGVRLEDAGRLISMFALPYAVMTPILALVTGRMRRRHTLMLYCALFCLGNVASAFAPGFGALLVARMLMGSVCGALLAVGVTFIPDLVGAARTSAVLSVVYAAFSVAMVVATSLGKLCAQYLGWHAAMYAVMALAVVVCAALVALMPATGSTDAPAPARAQLGLFREPAVITGIMVFVFGEGSVYVMYGYVSPYLEQVMGLSPQTASVVLMAFGVVTFFSNLLGGWVDLRLGVRALVGSFLLLAAVLLGMFAAGGATPVSVVLLMLVALLMYLASVPCVSLFMGTAHRRHPAALTLASSLEPMAFNVGIAVGTAIGGAVVSGLGLPFVTAVGAALSVAAAATAEATFRLARRPRG